MNIEKVLKKNILYRVRKIAGKDVLFGNNQCFELNETALFIWNNTDGVRTIKNIIHLISNEYNIPEKVIENNISNFIEELIKSDVFLEVI